jgi:hypothetical protein
MYIGSYVKRTVLYNIIISVELSGAGRKEKSLLPKGQPLLHMVHLITQEALNIVSLNGETNRHQKKEGYIYPKYKF